ncbi:MAG: hypothetical protein AB7O21_17255 [Gammaproteobacteria bacterium]
MKMLMMLLGLAVVFAGGTACFLAPPLKAPPPETGNEACAGLGGEAKRNCEQREP